MSFKPKEKQNDDTLFDQNPHIHQLSPDKDNPFYFIDGIGMINEEYQFYESIRKKLLIWNCKGKYPNKPGCFFISDPQNQKISGSKENIEYLYLSGSLLPRPYFDKYFHKLKMDDKIYNNYTQYQLNQKKNSKYAYEIPCMERMKIFKDMGNCLMNNNNKNIKFLRASYILYSCGIERNGYRDIEQHKKDCKKSAKDCNNHDHVLAQLCNNLSIVCFVDGRYKESAFWAREALKLNPKYLKCSQRLKIIKHQCNQTDDNK